MAQSSSGRIVVGLDGTPGGRAAVAFALRDAARRGAKTDVVVAFDTAETLAALCGTAVPPVTGSTADLHDTALREATAVVEEVNAELAGAGGQPSPVTVTAVGGDATRALLRAADGADLLVVGSRGRGGFASVVLGSVSVQCVIHAPCPVTVVHPALARA